MAATASAKRARRAKAKGNQTSAGAVADGPEKLPQEEQEGPAASVEEEAVAAPQAPPRRKRKRGATGGAQQGGGGGGDVAESWPSEPALGGGAEDRRGVVHLASVPMLMKVEKLRHLMEGFGEVGRIYLAPEDAADRKRRLKGGGNKKIKYTEGWVEFAERKLARRVAESLNGTNIGGKKRHNYYRDDIWNMKYLPKFKWHMLKEANIYNRQVRKARLEQKTSQAKRENDFYLERVEQAKNRRALQARLAAAKSGSGGGASNDAAAAASQKSKPQTRPLEPRRKAQAGAGAAGQAGPIAPGGDISDRILSSLF